MEIKSAVVARDTREAGRRKTLNFGHTLGHAIEHLSGYRLLHGEAVAIGMCLESKLAERAGVSVAGTADRIRSAIERAGLPTRRPDDLDPAAGLREQIDIDSMDFLNFMIALHRVLGVDVPEADYARLRTLDACVDYFAARVTSPAASAGP